MSAFALIIIVAVASIAVYGIVRLVRFARGPVDPGRPRCAACRTDLRAALLDRATRCPACNERIDRGRRPIRFARGARRRRDLVVGLGLVLLFGALVGGPFLVNELVGFHPSRWSIARLNAWLVAPQPGRTGRVLFELAQRAEDGALDDPAQQAAFLDWLLPQLPADGAGAPSAIAPDAENGAGTLVGVLARRGTLDRERFDSVARTFAGDVQLRLPANDPLRSREAALRLTLPTASRVPGFHRRLVLRDLVLELPDGRRLRPRARTDMGNRRLEAPRDGDLPIEFALPSDVALPAGPATLVVDVAAGLVPVRELAPGAATTMSPWHGDPDAWPDGAIRMDRTFRREVTIAATAQNGP